MTNLSNYQGALLSLYDQIYETINAQHDPEGVPSGKQMQDMEDLILMRETALMFISALKDVSENDQAPDEKELNELLLLIDEYISLANNKIKEVA